MFTRNGVQRILKFENELILFDPNISDSLFSTQKLSIHYFWPKKLSIHFFRHKNYGFIIFDPKIIEPFFSTQTLLSLFFKHYRSIFSTQKISIHFVRHKNYGFLFFIGKKSLNKKIINLQFFGCKNYIFSVLETL